MKSHTKLRQAAKKWLEMWVISTNNLKLQNCVFHSGLLKFWNTLQFFNGSFWSKIILTQMDQSAKHSHTLVGNFVKKWFEMKKSQSWSFENIFDMLHKYFGKLKLRNGQPCCDRSWLYLCHKIVYLKLCNRSKTGLKRPQFFACFALGLTCSCIIRQVWAAYKKW